MRVNRSSAAIVKVAVIPIFLILAIFGFLIGDRQAVDASAFGPSASHTDAPGEDNCTSCHVDFPVNTGGGSVAITGLPRDYLPNQQIPITVRTSHVGGTVFGFQMTAINSQGQTVGTFTLPNDNPPKTMTINGLVNLQVRTYVQHTVDGLFTPGVFDSNSWTFTWTAPAQRVGKISFYAAGNGADGTGSPGGDNIYTTATAALSGSAISNFDSDLKSDVAVYRPSNGVWYSLNSSNGGLFAAAFGTTGDKIVPGDYDGDGRSDMAVFRPSSGFWYIQKSTAGFTAVPFGLATDTPAPGDYDGDGKTDVAVFRPSNGVWYFLKSSNGAFDFIEFGQNGDKPVPGDFDADAKTDFAVFRPSASSWYIQRSTAGFTAVQFGLGTDIPVQSDYDGDGKTDVAVFRPSNGVWYRLGSATGFSAVAFGQNGDKPSPADLDGDGKSDVSVFRGGIWYALRSSDNSFFGVSWGIGEDIPVSNAYLVSGN